MPMNDEWEVVKPKPWIVNGKEARPEGLQLSESDDWKIGRAMEREKSKMREEIRKIARSVAQTEDDEVLATVRTALEEILDELDRILRGRTPEPESPLDEILQRLDALEGWAFRQGARL